MILGWVVILFALHWLALGEEHRFQDECPKVKQSPALDDGVKNWGHGAAQEWHLPVSLESPQT